MSVILIIDASKSSVVMTSEIFKDKVLNAVIHVAGSGKEAFTLLEKQQFDMIVVDFDLPDADGVTLVKLLRKDYRGPILMTAFPDAVVAEAVRKELFAYHDASQWLPKPVQSAALASRIDDFLRAKKRLTKRFLTPLDALLVTKGEGRGKPSPKVKGNVINLGIGGALVSWTGACKLQVGDEVSLTLSTPALKNKAAGIKNAGAAKSKTVTETAAAQDLEKGVAKIRAKIAWAEKKQAGLQFEDLSELHRKTLEALLQQAREL